MINAGRSGRQEGHCEALLQTGKPLTSRQLQFQGTIRLLLRNPSHDGCPIFARSLWLPVLVQPELPDFRSHQPQLVKLEAP